ncbi:MAG: VWA domain-containing protein [Planctomycetaceae bacterium]|jgi:Mg-chelatase subunit ChlD|nr:VWA domain-containing protein [Planctomycetaceae bacterium]
MITEQERLTRWRLLLGSGVESETVQLDADFLAMDESLELLYGQKEESAPDKKRGNNRRGSLSGSSPRVNRWLGNIRQYFPTSVVRVMQRDALERLGLQQMLLEPELLSQVEPDVHLVATLISLSRIIPNKTKATARIVVQKLVDDLMRKLQTKTIQAIKGSLNRASKNNRPRPNEIDFDRTIKANLKNWQPEHCKLIVDRFIGFGRKRSALRDIVLCVDQSGSMASSAVYSSIFAAVLASINSVSTRLVVFDTAVVDLTEMLSDPVDVLFGTQLGGGTDINQAVGYCQKLITRPSDTIFVLVTDLYEGGNTAEMLSRVDMVVKSGATVICLLALSDDGAPCFDEQNAAHFASIGVPTFACTPDKFPELMAAAINKKDITTWASQNEITTTTNRK